MTKQKPTGIGIVGSGGIAETHATAIALIPEAKLLAVQGRNQQSCQKLANAHGALACETFDQLLAIPDVEVVLIATPSGAHMDPTLAALDAGKHVLCEKPLEISVERARRMTSRAEAQGLLLGGFFPMRTGLAAQQIRKALDKGWFGRLSFVSARVKWWRNPSYYTESSWHGTQALDGGGALMNQGIHAVDLLQWMGGPISRVSAQAARLAHPSIEVEDTLSAWVEFANGALGTIEASTSAYPGLNLSLEISGTDGTIVMEDDRISTYQFRSPEAMTATPKDSQSVLKSGAADPKAISCEGHRTQIRSFLSSLRGESSSLLTGREAIAAISIVELCYQSAREGIPVTPTTEFD